MFVCLPGIKTHLFINPQRLCRAAMKDRKPARASHPGRLQGNSWEFKKYRKPFSSQELLCAVQLSPLWEGACLSLSSWRLHIILQELSLATVRIDLASLYWYDRQCKHCQKKERKGFWLGPVWNSNSPLPFKEFSFTHFSGHKLTTKEILFVSEGSKQMCSKWRQSKDRPDSNVLTQLNWKRLLLLFNLTPPFISIWD